MDWPRLKTAFADALTVPPDQRDAFLDDMCGDDAALRTELTALLDAADAPDDVFGPLADALAGVRPAVLAPGDAVAGTRIGVYRLVRPLGRGGMGTVYLAERADGQYDQQVALKLLHGLAPSDEARARFVAERQILARLVHPHIARLLDGGVTAPSPFAPEGVPFFVMEYVDGRPLLDHCTANALSLDARLALFLDVCDAVAFAHQRLIVHRDLKPANLFVDAAGTVKLLDFGIAKLLDDEASDGQTRAGLRPMTPEYAAPEQLAGQDVTTATDVYALGLVLYELLTGTRLSIEGRATEAIVPPSEAAHPAASDRLARRLRGDLDTVVLTALRLDPSRRYGTAAALADDLRRYRDVLPLRARPDTAAYRMRRFGQRHRAGVAAAAVLALSVLAGSGVALWQARVARAEAARAEATLTFLQNTLYGADPTSLGAGPDTPVREALDSAAAHVDAALADQPLVAAGVHSSVGVAYYNLGLYDRARRHGRRSLALYTAQGRPLEAAMERHNLAVVAVAEGKPDSAAALGEAAWAVVRRRGTLRQRGSVLNNLASAYTDLDRLDEAEAAYREALETWRAENAPGVPLAENNLALLLESRGRIREALPLMHDALVRLRDQGNEGQLGPILGVYGGLQDLAGYPDSAVTTLDSALAVIRRTGGPAHPSVVINLANQAQALRRGGRLAEAHVSSREAWNLARRTLDPGTPYYAHAALMYGHTLCLEDSAAGTALVRQALASRQAMLPPTHWLLAQTESILGECLLREGRFDEAMPLVKRGYDGLKASRGEADLRTREARTRREAALRRDARRP